jgi:orotidine-5'-phosphate decarboxylase
MATSRETFSARLERAIDEKNSCLVVGLDPVPESLPDDVRSLVRSQAGGAAWTAQVALAFGIFLEGVIDVIVDVAVAVKPNTAFFERLGAVGWDVLTRTARYAQRQGLVVITDAKRGDIGHTATAYADALLGNVPDTLGAVSDAVTLHPFTGSDGIQPFVDQARDRGKGLFILVRTSNPSAKDIQDLDCGGRPLYERVADLVRRWGESSIGSDGLSAVGAVVGATAPEEGARIRDLLPSAVFLVPGVGAQGGRPADLAPLFLDGGRGVIVNASRSILFPTRVESEDWKSAVRRSALATRDAIEAVRLPSAG